jgi:hypothetical protein
LQPAFDFLIQFAKRLDSEMMDMATGRESFNSSKARTLHTPRQDDMRVQAAVIQFVDRREDHSNLKAYSGLGGRNPDRATLAHEGHETFVERNGRLTLAVQKRLD